MTAIKLGARVTAPGRIVKSRAGDKRKWYKPTGRQKPVEGVYMGRRTYANGTVSFEDDVRDFHPDEFLKVGLIVTSTRTNAIPVFYDDITAVDDRRDVQIEWLRKALRQADCPHAIEPGDGTVGSCVDKGHCGCVLGGPFRSDKREASADKMDGGT